MSKVDFRALKTISGAIHYVLLKYGDKEISSRDWEFLCSYLGIDKKSIHSVQVDWLGFTLQTKNVSMRYHHHEFHEQRVIEIKG